jgi:hypothetical protein
VLSRAGEYPLFDLVIAEFAEPCGEDQRPADTRTPAVFEHLGDDLSRREDTREIHRLSDG